MSSDRFHHFSTPMRDFQQLKAIDPSCYLLHHSLISSFSMPKWFQKLKAIDSSWCLPTSQFDFIVFPRPITYFGNWKQSLIHATYLHYSLISSFFYAHRKLKAIDHSCCLSYIKGDFSWDFGNWKESIIHAAYLTWKFDFIVFFHTHEKFSEIEMTFLQ